MNISVKNKEGINVLSLFDGMSCGQLALQRLGVKVANYYASEIDKPAIKIAQKNFPGTIQLGDITKVGYVNGRLFNENGDYFETNIDLVIGGSPCQGFSFAGKGLNFNDPRSKLFFEFVRLVKDCNPRYFLLENVRMKKEHEVVITKMMGVNPVLINSALVSAQNRERLYWTNIGLRQDGFFGDMVSGINQPKDKGIVLKHIIQMPEEVDRKYYLTEKALRRILRRNYSNPKLNPEKTGTLNTVNNSGRLGIDSGTVLISSYSKIDIFGNEKLNQDKASCLTGGGHSGGNHSDMDLIVVHNLQPRSGDPNKCGTGHLCKSDGKSYCLDTNNCQAIQDRRIIQINPSIESGGVQPYQQNRIYHEDGIVPSLLSEMSSGTHAIFLNEPEHVHGEQRTYTEKSPSIQARYGTGGDNIPYVNNVRRLTPIECERLQTVPDNYTEGVSDSQRYKMLGNGWTIDVVAHIFSYMK